MKAAKACFALHDGLWEVKPAYGSEPARLFWQKAVAQTTKKADWMNGMFVFTTGNREENK